jgi:predicted dehydrogenase
MIRLGIVGAGSIVQAHIDAAKLCGFTPVAICGREGSPRASSVAKDNPGLTAVSNLSELLKFELDAILIAVSTGDAAEVLEKCLARNIPILIEKPVTSDPKVLRHLIDLSQLKVRVAYNRRFYSSVTRLKEELVNQSGLVQIVIPELSITSNSSLEERNNAVLQNSVHVFDLLGYLFGEITVLQTLKTKSENDIQYISAQMILGSDFIGSMHLIFETSENYSVKCWTHGKNLELTPLENFSKSIKMKLVQPSVLSPVKSYEKVFENWTISEDDKNAKPGFIGQYLEFKSFVQRGSSENLATLDDALKALNIGIALVNGLRDKDYGSDTLPI